jgi:putative beta-barrel porin BBP2
MKKGLRVAAVGILMGIGSWAIAAGDLPSRSDLPYTPDSPLTTDSPITRDSPSNIDFYIADQFTYNDNLYGLPSSTDATAVAGPLATRGDSFNSISLGGDGRWFSDNQVFGVNFRADENRFTHNDSLNNVSGTGKLEWDWRLQTDWSGQVGVSYYRGLANFANTGYYARDVVQREDYFGTLRYQVGPHWAIYGGFIGADTGQTAVAEQLYDFHSNAGNAGIEFATSSDNTITLDYRYTDATFPQDFVSNGALFSSDYREDTTRILVKYVFSAATELDASGGYLKRDYPVSNFPAFSGDIWQVALKWTPTDNLQWVVMGWRQLTAYVEAQSDYYVSTGGSIAAVWAASDTLALSVGATRENHDYINSSPSAITFASRYDRLSTDQARLVYSPTQYLTFKLAYLYEHRESNQAQFQYNDGVATASVTYMIRP